jgi:hypothetical protein
VVYLGPKTCSSLLVDEPGFLELGEDLLFEAASLVFDEDVSFFTSLMNSLHPQPESTRKIPAARHNLFNGFNLEWILAGPVPCCF